MSKILSVKSNNVPPRNYESAQTKSVEHDNTESSDKDLSKSAKLMIGAGAVAVAIAAGIIIAKRAKLPKGPKTKPSIKPDVNPEVKPKPEVKPNTDSLNPKTAEKPVEPVKTEEVKIDINTLKLELYEKATPLKEFKEIGKFENGKAILNSGEPFNGNMALEKENHRQILLEYKDGVITESTTIRRKSLIDRIKRYNKGILKEIGQPNDGIVTTYSRDKDGNRVIADIGFYTKKPYETITQISKQDGNVIKTCDYAKVNSTLLSEKAIYSKNKYVSEFILKDQPNIIRREIKTKQNGKEITTRFIENKETGEIEQLIPYMDSVVAHNGLPAYEIRYDGNYDKTKELVVLNENGTIKFSKHLNNENKFYLANGKNSCEGNAILTHNAEFHESKINTGDYQLYMSKENPQKIIVHGCSSSTEKLGGGYNIETKEIDGGYYNINKLIQKELRKVFGKNDPINIDKLYEQNKQLLTSIENDMQNLKKIDVVHKDLELN